MPLVDELFDAKYRSTDQGKDLKPWETAEQFDQIYGDFGAVAELPVIAFVPELLKAYPDTKVVYIERNVDEWFTSLDKGSLSLARNPLQLLAGWMDPSFYGALVRTYNRVLYDWMGLKQHHDYLRALIPEVLLPRNVVTFSEKQAKKDFLEHDAMVKELVPPERLLIFKLSDGWEPLCKFLGKPIPEKPFPHLNERAWLNEKFRIASALSRKKGSNSWAYLITSVAVGAGAFAYCIYSGKISTETLRNLLPLETSRVGT